MAVPGPTCNGVMAAFPEGDARGACAGLAAGGCEGAAARERDDSPLPMHVSAAAAAVAAVANANASRASHHSLMQGKPTICFI